MLTIQLSKSTQRAFNESLRKIVKKGHLGAEKQMKKRAKLLVGQLISHTPPSAGKFGRTGIAAKKAGEKRVEAEIRKLFMPVPKNSRHLKGKSEQGPSYIAAYHKQNRSGGKVRGRARRGRALRRVPAGRLNTYIRYRKGKVGTLAAGWNAGAKKFGVSSRNWPSWVKRHNTPSHAEFRTSKKRISIKVANRTSYGENVKVLQHALNRGLSQAMKNNKLVMRAYEDEARARGF